ncbi:hypothetical protein O181_069165 [Austropuccinia psidii MF-1]|uniref:Uncharacterized protein n=1 Tax=Austropuccinia psidii MF-1 TaxID=1389203 RepID=A0A9Q3I7T3_9BASI|nr:hypothetical protein [Austropuccinia psidii MF-1]
MWEWVTSINPPSMCPPSPLLFLVFCSALPEPPSAELAFHTFINGDYNLWIFVEDPKTLFLIGDAANPQGSKPTAGHTYTLRPRNQNGYAIASFVQR